MADVFLSYHRADFEVAKHLAKALEREGLTVWWDRAIHSGVDFAPSIEREMNLARTVVVVWSAEAVESAWIHEEATKARSAGKLFQVLAEAVAPPSEFMSDSTADLSAWTGSSESGEFKRLLKAVRPSTEPKDQAMLSTPPSPVLVPRPTAPTLQRFDLWLDRDLGRSPDRTMVAVNSPPTIGAAWDKIRAYVYPWSDHSHVKQDAESLRGDAHAQHSSAEANTSTIEEGTNILISLHLDGVECRRTQQRFRWRKRWHKIDFDVRYKGDTMKSPQRAAVSWFAGMVCIGQLNFVVELGAKANAEPQSAPLEAAPGYEAVFVSYSTKDRAVVDWLEESYKALGMTYLRDVRTLRSGEKWDERLLQLIEGADLFQLCWSKNAKKSEYVTNEWRHALGLSKPNFIRPCYWHKPMPDPPPELQGSHFSPLKLNWLLRAWLRIRAVWG